MALLASTLFFAAHISFYLNRVLNVELDGEIKLVAKNLASRIGNQLMLGDPVGVSMASMEAFQNSPDLLYLVVSNPDFENHSLVFTRDGWADDQATEWPVYDPKDLRELSENRNKGPRDIGRHRYYTMPVRYQQIPEGRIHIGYSLETLEGAMANMRDGVLRTTLMAFLIGLALSFLFSRQITKPIKSLREFAQGIAFGNLDQRIDIRTKDEIGELAHSMNTMTSRLEASRLLEAQSLKNEAELREKEILLREIHHRVKNNLQILLSLLRMQSRRLDCPELTGVLGESENRIRSMALIHERLYQSESLSSVHLQPYFESLTSELRHVYTGGQGVGIQIEAEDIHLELDTALPCGLIVSELVSNALKYAFVESGEGHVKISVEEQAGAHHLVVEDDGIGLDAPPSFESKESLGLRLVQMLVDQLDGTLTFQGEQGCRFGIIFNESQYAKRV